MRKIVKIDYGKESLEISINPSWNVTVFYPNLQKALEKPVQEIRKAIKNPIEGKSLQKIIENKKKSEQSMSGCVRCNPPNPLTHYS